MPDPGRYRGEGAKKRFMEECMRRTKQEGKTPEQSAAMCLNMFRREKGGDKYPPKRKAVIDHLRNLAKTL